MIWKEIQVAIWGIAETMDYDLEKIKNSLAGSVSGYNPDYVHNILNDVKQNSVGYEPGPGDIKIVKTNSGKGYQELFVECNTAGCMMKKT